jgi:hypothetical protein
MHSVPLFCSILGLPSLGHTLLSYVQTFSQAAGGKGLLGAVPWVLLGLSPYLTVEVSTGTGLLSPAHSAHLRSFW